MNRSRNKKRKYNSCNRTVNTQVIQNLVKRSGITSGDTVYDIGAGTGSISRELLRTGARVIGIENDLDAYRKCKARLLSEDRFELYLIDFLQWQFPADKKYKVFANIPFMHTADFLNKLLLGDQTPGDCYVIIQREAAELYTGTGGETMKSLLVKPYFWVDILYYFDRKDFYPTSSVDAVLIQFEKRRYRLVPEEYTEKYREFIEWCRKDNVFTVKKMLSGLFTWPQVKRIAGRLRIDLRARPSDLNFMQYMGIFQFYLMYGRP